MKAAVREEALKATEMFSHGGGQDIVTKVLVEASATRQAELYRRAFLFDALVRVHREMSDLYR